MELQLLKMPKCKKGRVPRKLKKAWKKEPYFSILEKTWIFNYKSNNYSKYLEQIWGKTKN